LVVCASKVYSALGADIVIESLRSKWPDRGFERYRLVTSIETGCSPS